MRLELVDNSWSALWDFGWFDRSRFRIVVDAGEGPTPDQILQAYIRSSLYPRRFCTSPDPWGAPVNHHGPFLVTGISAGSYVPTTLAGLDRCARAVLNSPKFASPPSADQITHVDAWLHDVRDAGAHVYFLQRTEPAESLIDWHGIWNVFTEMIGVVPSRSELMVAVLGYD